MKSHTQRTLLLLVETVFIYLVFMSLWRYTSAHAGLLVLYVLATGVWLERLFVVAHEGVHKKLLPTRPVINDLITWVLLLPVGVPLTIYRKIHYFHHGFNRKNEHTAALDCFSVERLDLFSRITRTGLWFYYVYCGGFFVHGIVTVLLFLFVPGAQLRRISDVFLAWTPKLRLLSWVQLLCTAVVHCAAATFLTPGGWLTMIGAPLLVFAWSWSLKLYIYHYDQALGPDVRRNVRSCKPNRFLSWLLLNFNEHAAHHFDPTRPWYELKQVASEIDGQVQERVSIFEAILEQGGGPLLIKRARPERVDLAQP